MNVKTAPAPAASQQGNSAQHATSPRGGTPSTGNVSAALAAAGVSVLNVPQAITAYASSPPPKDKVDNNAGRPKPQGAAHRQDGPVADKVPQENPFKSLKLPKAAAAPMLRLRDAPWQNEPMPELSLAQLAKLFRITSKSPASPDRLPRLLTGTMLLASDAQGALPGKSIAGLQSFGEKLMNNKRQAALEDFKILCRLQKHALNAQRININAFVQRALREAYLIGSSILLDHANKVKHFNEMKKRIREQLNHARETQTRWSAEAHGEGGYYIASDPFELALLDEVTGEWYTEPTTEEDVQYFNTMVSRMAEGQQNSPVGSYAALRGPSTLSAEEKALLDEVTNPSLGRKLDPLRSNKKPLKDNMDEVLRLIPHMNQSEFLTYVPKILSLLNSGITSASSDIVRVFQACTPAQTLLLYTLEHSHQAGEGENFFGAGQTGSTNVGVKAIAGFFSAGFSLGTAEIVTGVAKAASSVGSKKRAEIREKAVRDARAIAEALGVGYAGELTPEKAMQLLDELEKHYQAQEKESQKTQGPQVGEPKAAYTLEQLKDYIQKLEDQLSSVGEDSQLANIDLQQVLQQQQQTLQTMSNISKVLHDTAMAIIRQQS